MRQNPVIGLNDKDVLTNNNKIITLENLSSYRRSSKRPVKNLLKTVNYSEHIKIYITLAASNFKKYLNHFIMRIKIILFTLVIGSLGLMTSCSDDDYSPSPPVITYPDNGTPTIVAPGGTVDFTFTVSAPRGYASHLLTWSAGSVLETTALINLGDTDFTISGQFTAGPITGPGGISVAVTDKEGSSSLATFAVVVQ